MPSDENTQLQPSGRRAFVVVGMHRSGTSAMTRMLSLLGAALPKRLMPSQDDNPAGFWEPQSVADLNDEILQALDSEWDDVFAFRPRTYLSNFDRFYLGRARDVIEEEFDGSQVIVLKDPRISVLTSFWDRALREAGYETHYIVMVRNPLEVADSLRVRNAFPREKSLLLWSSYMLAVDRDTREQTRTFVAFEQLMGDWRAVRDRIQGEAGIPFFRDTPAAAIEIDRFIDRRLRHHAVAPDDLSARPDVPDEVKALYRIFAGACYGQDIDLAAIDAARLELEKIDSFVGPVLADLSQRARALTNDVAHLQQAHATATERAESLEQQLAAKESERNELTARLAQVEEQNQRHIAERNLMQEQLADAAQVRASLDAREGELSELQAEIEQGRAEIEQVRGDLERTRVERDEVRTSLAELAKAQDRLSAEKADLQGQLKISEGQLHSLRSDHDRARADNDRRIGELKAAVEAAQKKSREHDERWAAHFGETAALSRMLLEREKQVLRETDKVAKFRELYHALATPPRWWAVLPRARRTRLEHRRLRRLGLFDAESYLRNNPDVAQSEMDPVRHYLLHGIDEDRQV